VFARVARLLEMIRFSHTLFALPFALLAALMAWTAEGRGQAAAAFRWPQLAGILLCMVFARSAAMSFNRLVDRRIDAENPRTRGRHLPAGIIGPSSAAWFALTCALSFVASTLLFLPNRIPLLASVPVLMFLLAYSYTKRFTALAHFWLGAALMLAPVAAWLAIRGRLEAAPLILGGAVLLWVAGFDIIYACQDYDFDRRVGLHSMPAWLGVGRALRLSALCHLAMVVLLVALPFVFPYLRGFYWCGVAAVGLLLLYEHWIVRPDDLERINVAFFHVNWIVSVLLLVVGTADLLT
jgi:4-hydroxybenzoate polyprenyltransferase